MQGGPVDPPVEEGVGDDGLGNEGRAVALVHREVVAAEGVAEHRRVPVDLALDRLGVGVEQQLGRVAAMAGGRLVGAVDPEAVALARAHVGQVAVPAEGGHLGERDALLGSVVVEQAQLDAGGDLGEEGEVGAGAVVGGAEGEGLSGPESHRAGTLPGWECAEINVGRHSAMSDHDGFEQHDHPALAHSHGHYHVTHNYNERNGSFDHLSSHHQHEHDHAALRHSHYPHENFEHEHEGEAHIHDHEQAVRPATARKAARRLRPRRRRQRPTARARHRAGQPGQEGRSSPPGYANSRHPG